MSRNGGAQQQANTFLSRTADVLGILSFFLAAGPIVKAVETKSVAFIVLAGLSLAAAGLILFRRKKLARSILWLFLNLTAPSKSYKFTKKEVVYEFKTRTAMRHEKNFSVKVLHPSFSGISDKYKWTGEGRLNICSKDPKHYSLQPLRAKFGLERYRLVPVGDKRYSAGESIEMGAVIEDISDPNSASSLHLSSGIYEKTDCLVLKVLFTPTLQPVNARKLEYIHYIDDDHYRAEACMPTLEGEKKCLEWVIEKPLYGGKYMIEWEF